MTWIRVATNLCESDRVLAVAGGCGISAEACVGFLVRWWGRIAEHRPDGDLTGMTDDALEVWAGWNGMPSVFATQLRKVYMDKGIVVDWMDEQGKLAARAAADRRRKRRGSSAEIPSLRNDTVRVLPDNSAPAELTDQLHRTAWGALCRASRNPAAWIASVRAIADGLHPPAYPWAVIGQALADMSANGQPPNIALLRGCCQRLTTPRAADGKPDTPKRQLERMLAEERAKEERARADAG